MARLPFPLAPGYSARHAGLPCPRDRLRDDRGDVGVRVRLPAAVRASAERARARARPPLPAPWRVRRGAPRRKLAVGDLARAALLGPQLARPRESAVGRSTEHRRAVGAP